MYNTYDIVFNDDQNSNCEGFSSTLQYCKDYIAANNGTKNSYFEDYKGGTVSVICNQTSEIVYETEVL